ncbi:hypothetical protein Ahy_A02g009100 [Arachis hypogaea]|uniref:Transposase MuDR plant domain-containing protein n=1 Tax=Arachis hypogaea TaxID=3818 RepID=A0A445EG94_ARAHY|nr:hypothetical protein Ahy_A02g009100 [Arachis hypogaea]
MIELYVEFKQHMGMDVVGDDVNVDELGDIDWEEDNNDSEEEFEANYEVDDENDDRDLVGNPAVQNEAHAVVSRHPFDVPSFMWTLDLEYRYHYHLFYLPCPTDGGSHVVGEGNIAAKYGEFSVGMEFGSRESVISASKIYTISRGVDYTVYESEPQIFYAKCKGYGVVCDWLIRANLIRKKGCGDQEIQWQTHSIFNYTVSYRKAWLAKQKSITKYFGDWKVSYQTLPVWLKATNAKMPRFRIQINCTLVTMRPISKIIILNKQPNIKVSNHGHHGRNKNATDISYSLSYLNSCAGNYQIVDEPEQDVDKVVDAVMQNAISASAT